MSVSMQMQSPHLDPGVKRWQELSKGLLIHPPCISKDIGSIIQDRCICNLLIFFFLSVNPTKEM